LSLLDQGATWGLLAHEYLGGPSGTQALLDAVTRAIALRTGDIHNGGGAVPPPTPTTSASPSVTPSTKPTPTPSRTHSPSPSPSPTPTPTGSCDPVRHLLGLC
jgi:hypothetical protein